MQLTRGTNTVSLIQLGGLAMASNDMNLSSTHLAISSMKGMYVSGGTSTRVGGFLFRAVGTGHSR
jgi:hypothetical protein